MKLSASKFNEKNVFRQFQKKKKKISQMSAVRTGVRAYMDTTPLRTYKLEAVERLLEATEAKLGFQFDCVEKKYFSLAQMSELTPKEIPTLL